MQPNMPLPSMTPQTAAPSPVRGVSLQPGMEGVARVLSDHGAGRYTLVIGGAAVSVQSAVVLSPGQDLPFTVVRDGNQIALRLGGAETAQQEATSGTGGKAEASASGAVATGDRVEVGREMVLRIPAGGVSAVVLEASSSAGRDVPVVMERGVFHLQVDGGRVVTASTEGQAPAQPLPPAGNGAQPQPLPPTSTEGQAQPPASTQSPVANDAQQAPAPPAPPAPAEGSTQPAPTTPPAGGDGQTASSIPPTSNQGQPAQPATMPQTPPPPAQGDGYTQPAPPPPVTAEGQAQPPASTQPPIANDTQQTPAQPVSTEGSTQPAPPPPVTAEGQAQPPASTQPPVASDAQQTPAQPAAPASTQGSTEPAPPSLSLTDGQTPAQSAPPAPSAPAEGSTQPAPASPPVTTDGQTPAQPATIPQTPPPVTTDGQAQPHASTQPPVANDTQQTPAQPATMPQTPPPVTTNGQAQPPAPAPGEGSTQPAPPPAQTPTVDAGRTAFAIRSIEQPVLLHVQARPDAAPIPTTLTLPPTPSTAAALAPDPGSPTMAQVVDRPADASAILSIQDARIEVALPPQADLAIGDHVRIEPQGDALLRGLLHLLPQGDDATLPAGDVRFDAALRQAGLTPSHATREAAAALAQEHVPVQRAHVQALLAMAAGRSGTAREQTLAASARLLALDAPLSPPLAAGIAQRDMVAAPSLSDQLRNAMQRLGDVHNALTLATPAPGTPSGTPPATDGSPIPAAPSSTANAPASPVPTSTANASDIPSTTSAPTATAPQAASVPLPDPASVTTPLQNAMRNLQALSVLLETPDTAAQLSAFTNSFGRETLAYTADQIETAATAILRQSPTLQKLDAAIAQLSGSPAAPPPNAPAAGTILHPSGIIDPTPLPPMGTLPGVDGLAYPGVDPEPGGIWTLPAPEAGRWVDAARVETLLRDILDAATPEAAAVRVGEAARTLDRETLRALGRRLQEEEAARIGEEPALRSLREASGEVRDLGRRFLAMKAEALSTLRQDPPMFVADVPIRFRDEDHDSHLRMFYRKGGGKKKQPWDQRVLLDLDLSALGTVMGDLRFAGGMLSVRILAQDAASVAELEADADTLALALQEKGFPCQPSFAMLPTLPVEPPPPAAAPPAGSPPPPASGAPREASRSRIDTRA